jgi:O-antigen ligase
MGIATRSVERAGAVLFALALLLPVGDAPWFSFWREWVASIAVLLLTLGAASTLRDEARPLRVPLFSVPAFVLALAGFCWLQFAFGIVPWREDALLGSTYLAGFALCWAFAASLPDAERAQLVDRLAAALLAAALLSAPLAVAQWVGWVRGELGLPMAGGRPVAHMEQANLLCSLLIEGIVGAWRLHARGRIGARAVTAALLLLLPAVVLTQSRVAWLVGLTALAVAAWRRDLVPWRGTGRVIVALVVLMAVGTLARPALDADLGLTGVPLRDRMSEGLRPTVWTLFADAIALRPWTGWGVLQTGAAQFEVAPDHPSVRWFFSSAHNVALDLMVWFGMPLGLLAAAVLFIATAKRLAAAASPEALATAFAAVALLLHSLVELPLHYAYFLLPLGLMLGSSAVAPAPSRTNVVGLLLPARRLVPLLALLPTLMLAWMAREYVALSDRRPILGIDEPTRHLLLTASPPAPDVFVLDRLQAFHAFAALPLEPGLANRDLDAAQAMMRRVPTAPAIERAALLDGINGHAGRTFDALRRLCKFESTAACDESMRAWELWRLRWQQLPPWSPGTSSSRR